MDPHRATTHGVLGLEYQNKAMHAPAIAATRKAVELSSGATFLTAMLGVVQAAAGDRDEAEEGFAQVQEISKQKYVTPYAMARLCAGLGQSDEDPRWLGTGYPERAAMIGILRNET